MDPNPGTAGVVPACSPGIEGVVPAGRNSELSFDRLGKVSVFRGEVTAQKKKKARVKVWKHAATCCVQVTSSDLSVRGPACHSEG